MVTKATNMDINFLLSQDIGTLKRLEDDSIKIIKSEEKYKELMIKALSRKVL